MQDLLNLARHQRAEPGSYLFKHKFPAHIPVDEDLSEFLRDQIGRSCPENVASQSRAPKVRLKDCPSGAAGEGAGID